MKVVYPNSQWLVKTFMQKDMDSEVSVNFGVVKKSDGRCSPKVS
jgi:hypothetical protein